MTHHFDLACILPGDQGPAPSSKPCFKLAPLTLPRNGSGGNRGLAAQPELGSQVPTFKFPRRIEGTREAGAIQNTAGKLCCGRGPFFILEDEQ